MKSLIRKTIRRAGYDLQRARAPLYGSAEDFSRALEIVRPNTMLPESRLLSLYEQAAFCELQAVPGAFVECGVWKGGAVAMMAAAVRDRPRPLHLFDSFTDICEPSEIDGANAVAEMGGRASGRLQAVDGAYDSIGGHGTREECERLLDTIGYQRTSVHYHVGWFQDTVPVSDTGPIAILRIDGDWYASTKVCLDHLYDRVVTRGFVIIDDYGAYEGCKKAVDEFLAERGITAFLSSVDDICAWFVKP